jgi:glycosyltransferase involved in cell wall biosynthesis
METVNAQDKNINILLLGTQMEKAGAQHVLLSQARWFHEKGHTVQAVFFYDKQGLAKTWQAASPFPVLSLGGRKPHASFFSNTFRFLVGLVKLYRLLRNGPNVAITFTPQSNLLGLPLAWLVGIPVRLGTYHGQIAGLSNFIAWLHGRLSNSRICNVMVCVSPQLREHAIKRERVHPDRLVVIENGVDVEERESNWDERRVHLRNEIGLTNEEFLLLAVGRLSIEKGHTFFLDALSQIVPRHPNVRLALVGDGPLRASLETQAERSGISEKVMFLGSREHVPELLTCADVYVQPSLSEGLSLALLEALAIGLPVVATQISGFTSVVEQEKTALLVPPGDADSLAHAIDRLILDAGLRIRIAQAGNQLVKTRYSAETMHKSYERLIQGLLIKSQNSSL